MSRAPASIALGLLVTLGCDADAPKSPTFIDDIRPLVQANCIRCHTHPAQGGAPDSFRLDVYDNTELVDGQLIRGAKTMAEYMAARAGTEGTMPPDFARGERLRGSFENWFPGIGTNPRLGAQASNAPPEALLLSELPASADNEVLTLEYQISDNDGDLVHGRLKVGDVLVADDLHSGKGRVEFSAATFANGEYEIVAEISDGTAAQVNGRGFITEYPFSPTIGTLTVQHADGNTAPRIELRKTDELGNSIATAAVHDELYADLQSPVALRINLSDPDLADTHLIDVVAFRGDEEIAVASQLPLTAGSLLYDWDTTSIPEGPGWRLRVTATDSGGARTTIESGRIIISHATTTQSFTNVAPLLAWKCGPCHNSEGTIPNLAFPLAIDPTHDEDDVHGKIEFLRGPLYKRVVLQKNMPPRSANTLREGEGFAPLTDEERAQIADYLLGGSPR